MKTQLTSIISILLLLFVGACQPQEEPAVDERPIRSADAGPAKVELVQNDGQYQLLVDGQPFYIKGAGLEFGSVEQLAEHGANSFRTWRTDNGQDTGMEVLDEALEHASIYSFFGLCANHNVDGFVLQWAGSSPVAKRRTSQYL